ncbi:hypothetical protein FS749_002943 [Ceratobasidium sp. UAMH 11750]|nr:hypothetical protein FS749_002943 [Ceratobasidium sp. UAMH 11750]
MYFAILPLLVIATTLQEPLFDYFNNYYAANLAGVSSWFNSASGSALEVLRGTVTYVEIRRVQGRVQPMFPLLTADVWMSIRFEDTPFTYFSSIFAVTSDPGASAIYGPDLNLSDSESGPTRPFSAVVPIRGLVNRLPASATTPAFPPPTVLAATPHLENRHTPNSTSPSSYPEPTRDANSISSASIPTLTLFPVTAPSSNGGLPSGSYGEFETTGHPTVIVAQIVVVASTSGVAHSLPSSFPSGSDIHTVATLVQVATSTSVPVISPGDYLALFAATKAPSGRAAWIRQHAWILLSALSVPICLAIGIRLYLARRRRVEAGHSGPSSPTIVHHPAPAPEEAERSDLLELRRLRDELGDLPAIIRENGISPTQLREYVKLVVRTRQSVYGTPTPTVRHPPSSPTSSAAGPSATGTNNTPGDNVPGPDDHEPESNVPAASCSVEQQEIVGYRVGASVSPPVRKSPKRSSGPSIGETSPAPEPSRSCARSGAPRAGSTAANDLGEAGPNSSDPVATLPPVCEREPGSLAVGRARRTAVTAMNADPTHSGIVLPSQAAPSLLREPVPPRPSGYVSCGTLAAHVYVLRPLTPESDSECNAPIASCTVERLRTQIRATENVSPLAHKSVKRTSGLSMGAVSPTPEPSRTRARSGAPRAGGSAANDRKHAGSVIFDPVATSSSVCEREPRSPAVGRARRTTATARNADPTRSGIALPSQVAPSPLREPLPPRPSGYGTLAHTYVLPPIALESGSESDGPVASCAAEQRMIKIRASENVSPLAHKSVKRTSGLSMGAVSPTPEPSRSHARSGAPRDGDCATNKPEATGSTWLKFEPARTSTPSAERESNTKSTWFEPDRTSTPLGGFHRFCLGMRADIRTNDLEGARSRWFEPDRASTPRERGLLAATRASQTTAPARSADQPRRTRSGLALSS